MDFSLIPEHEMTRRIVREFAEQEVAPVIKDRDVDFTPRVVTSVHVGLNSLGLLQWGTEEQKERWLVPQARGERFAAYALGYREDRPLCCELPPYEE